MLCYVYAMVCYAMLCFVMLCYIIYLLLAECGVRTVSYGPSVSLPFMAQARSARALKTRKEKRGSITCRTDRGNEANKIIIIWLC